MEQEPCETRHAACRRMLGKPTELSTATVKEFFLQNCRARRPLAASQATAHHPAPISDP